MPSTSTGVTTLTGICTSSTGSACTPHLPTTPWTSSTGSCRNSEAGLWRVDDESARPQPTEWVKLPAAWLAWTRCRRVHRSPMSGFAAYATEGIDRRGRVTGCVSEIGSPPWNRHQARLDQLQPLEVAGDLLGAAEMVGERSTFVVALLGLRKCLADDVGSVIEGQVTAVR